MEKLAEINSFRVRKTTVSSTFLIRLRFQVYRCKSGIVILAYRGKLEITLTVPLTYVVKMNIPVGVCLVTANRFLR